MKKYNMSKLMTRAFNCSQPTLNTERHCFNPYRSGPYSHLNRSGGGLTKPPPSISETIIDRDPKIFLVVHVYL